MSQLVTGEAVALDLRTAALPSRVLAGLIDAGVQGAALTALLAIVFATGRGGSSARGIALTLTVTIAVLLGYPVASESLTRGRTLGKAAMGLRVVRDDGGPIGFRQAFVRGLVGLAVERPGVTLFTGAVLTSLLNSRGKRLGDLLAGTVVLQERVAVATGPVAMMPPGLAAWATTLDLGGLTDDVALSARQFLARAGQLTPSARTHLGNQLVEAIQARTTPPPPPGTPGGAYLSAVLAERRRREEARLAPRPAAFGPAPGYGPPPGYGPAPAYGPPPGYGPGPGYGQRPDTGAPAAWPPVPPAPDSRVPDAPPAAGPGGFAPPA